MTCCKAQAVASPLGYILDHIPYTEEVLGPDLYDKIRESIASTTDVGLVTDSYIVLLLSYLTDAGLVSLTSITPVTATGKIYFIRKIENGK